MMHARLLMSIFADQAAVTCQAELHRELELYYYMGTKQNDELCIAMRNDQT